MVMPRSRSMSIESRYCSRISRASTAPVISRIRSERVDLPWSMWATMAMLRMSCGFTPLVPRLGVYAAGERLAGAEAADVVLDALGQLLADHFRPVGRVRRDDGVVEVPERMPVGQGLGIGDVEG